MKQLAKIIAITLAMGIISTSAQANSTFTGCYGQASLGYSVFSADQNTASNSTTENTIQDINSPNGALMDALNRLKDQNDGNFLLEPPQLVTNLNQTLTNETANGVSYGIGAGCDYSPDNFFVIGVFGGYTYLNDASWESTLTAYTTNQLVGFDDDGNPISEDIPLLDTSDVTSHVIKLKDKWTIATRSGVIVGSAKKTLIYGLLGWAHTNVDGDADDMEGFIFGGGMEAIIYGPLALKAEYQFTNYDSEHLYENDADTYIDLDEHAINVALVYRFGL